MMLTTSVCEIALSQVHADLPVSPLATAFADAPLALLPFPSFH